MEYIDLKAHKSQLTPENYFEKHGISNDILQKFGVTISNNSSGKIKINFPYPNGRIKYYFPLGKDLTDATKNFYWETGKFGKQEPFGYDKLPQSGDVVFIIGGEKDCLLAWSLGYFAITLGSEKENYPNEIIIDLLRRFNTVIILFDNDSTGIDAARKLKETHYIESISFPEAFGVKDISDFMLINHDAESLISILNKEIEKVKFSKPSFSAYEALYGDLKFSQEWIINNIIPAQGLVCLVGGSDIGKSTLLSQLAISLTIGNPFLGVSLKSKGPTLYLTLEEFKPHLIERTKQIVSNLKIKDKEDFNNLIFCNNAENVFETIDQHLKVYPETKMIVVDPFSSVFDGDINGDTTKIKRYLKKYSVIAEKNNLLVCFIHHVPKNAEKSNNFSKHDLLGNTAIEATFRVIFEIKKRKDKSVDIGIVKGNIIKPEFKVENDKLWNLCRPPNQIIFELNQNVNRSPSSPSDNPKDDIYTIQIIEAVKTDEPFKIRDLIKNLTNKDSSLDSNKIRRTVTKLCENTGENGTYRLKKKNKHSDRVSTS